MCLPFFLFRHYYYYYLCSWQGEIYIHVRKIQIRRQAFVISYDRTVKCHINSHFNNNCFYIFLYATRHPPSWHWIFFLYIFWLWVFCELGFFKCNHGYIYFGDVEHIRFASNTKQWPSWVAKSVIVRHCIRIFSQLASGAYSIAGDLVIAKSSQFKFWIQRPKIK